MDIDEEIKKLKDRGPDKPIPLPKMAKLTAAMLDKAAVGWTGKIFYDKEFERRRLSRFYVQYRARLEGIEISPIARALVKARHLKNDLLDKFGIRK